MYHSEKRFKIEDDTANRKQQDYPIQEYGPKFLRSVRQTVSVATLPVRIARTRMLLTLEPSYNDKCIRQKKE
jgi:hypothetical protein